MLGVNKRIFQQNLFCSHLHEHDGDGAMHEADVTVENDVENDDVDEHRQ